MLFWKKSVFAFILILIIISLNIIAYAVTDLEVTYIERTPKYYSYQTVVTYSGKYFTDDYLTYYATYATGLGGGQNQNTKRWPDLGETVTWIAHVYNRGTTTISSFNYVWTLDGNQIGSGTYNNPLAPGAFATFAINWSWEFVEHDLKFTTTVSGDSHPNNNELMIYTNSLGLYTFIDFGFAQAFKDYTPNVPNPSTDSITEWLQLHCRRMNDMFIEAGSFLRWRYDRLDLISDYPAPMPSIDNTNYDGSFPQRYYIQPGQSYSDPRTPGYYNQEEDIDYGLLHEIGHQLGIIDLYQMDVPGSANEVNGEGYYSQPCLMHGCSPFISRHTALAMNNWHGKRRGFFGQYLYDIPTTNKIRVLSSEGLPVADANITVYEFINTTSGKRIPNVPKFTGKTNADGLYTIPNVILSENWRFWSDTGNVLNDNPFGYVWCIGINCVFFIKMEKEGKIDYEWLDITNFNIAYWQGNVNEATYDIHSSFNVGPAIVGGLDLAFINRPYNAKFQVVKGTPPYSFELLRGTLPPGINFHSDGSFSGIPTVRGDYPIVVRMTDSSAEPFISEWDVTVQVIAPGLWQMFQNTKRRVGTSLVAGPSQYSSLWVCPNSSIGNMAPAIQHADIYYGASWPSNTVWKINANGVKQWQSDGNVGGHLNGTPAIGLDGESENSVYIGGGYILDINKNTGYANWSTNPDGYGDYIALGSNSTVYAHRWANTMYGVRDMGSTSSIVFTGVDNHKCRGGAALYDLYDEGEIMVWGGRHGAIYAVRTSDFSYLWTLELPGTRIDSTPSVDSLNMLYFAGSLYDKEYFFAVDGRKGKIVWDIRTNRDSIWCAASGALSVDQKTYYVQTQGTLAEPTEPTELIGKLYAINTADGTIKWEYNTMQYGGDSEGSSAIVDKDNKVYVSANQTIYCIKDNTTSPEVLWTVQASGLPLSFSIDRRGVLLMGASIGANTGLHAIYSFQPETPVIFNAVRNSTGTVTLTWESQFNANYRIDAYTTTESGYLGDSTPWTTLVSNIASAGFVTTWEDTALPASGYRFYRIVTKNP